MKKLSQIGFEVQEVLFPLIEKEVEEPLTKKMKQWVTPLELVRIEDRVRTPEYWRGRSPRNRKQVARAFIAKAVYNMDTTRQLIDRLKIINRCSGKAGGKSQNCETEEKKRSSQKR